MRPFWKLNIQINAIDGFLYMGRLFVLLKDGTLRYINLEEFSATHLGTIDKNPLYADRIFFNNHLIPKQGSQWFNYWRSRWEVLSEKSIDIEIDEGSLSVISDISSPVLDLKIYGQKLILATRHGVYEAAIDFSSEETTSLKTGLEKVFDSKSTHLSTKAGEVFISSVDGLFRASYWNKENRLEVDQKPIESLSLRTNWRLYDLVNFEAPTKFRFYYNQTEQVTGDTPFAQDEGEATMKRIKDFGFKQFSSDSLFSKNFDLNDIYFVFNSNSYVFVIFKNGTFRNYGINFENYEEKNLTTVSQGYSLPELNISELGRPLNALTVPTGTLIEFFDRIILAKKGLHEIESQPVSSMRTYPNSFWYKNIITTFKENCLTITALNPF
jgi:hypothetical protein